LISLDREGALPGSSSFSFTLPARVRFGEGEVRALPAEAQALGLHRPLVVTDSYLAASEAFHSAIKDCRAAGLEVRVWAGVVPNPTDTSVHQGLAQYQSGGCDGLVALGGGSAIDTAKAIGVLVASGGQEIGAYFEPDPAPIAPLPTLIALPTTAGTGSEVTWVAIVTSSRTGRKAVIRNRALFPTLSIVDPSLTVTMPPALTRHTGLDALSHAIETYTSRQHAPVSEPLAFRSIQLILESLPQAVRAGADRETRRQMSLAATMAGIAFTNSMLHTGHHVSHVLTSRYHLAHGLACILTIPAMLAYLRPVVGYKIARLAPLFGAPHDASQEEAEVWVVEGIQAFLSEVGVPSMEEVTGEGAAAIPGLVAEVLEHGANPFSPRPMDDRAYTWILERTFNTGKSLADRPPDPDLADP
jgi:alcohol dehydrogenase class IV